MTLRIMFKKESTEGFDQIIDDEAIQRIIKETGHDADAGRKVS